MALLHGQVCIVTGAGQGLERAVALEMPTKGQWSPLLERNADTVKKVASEIGLNGARGALRARYHGLRCVWRRDHRCASLIREDRSSGQQRGHKRATKTILQDTLENWRRTIEINLEAVYMGSKLVAPHMAQTKSGRIIHIASIQGFASSGTVGFYNAAKGGIISLTKSMAVELGPYILVNAVAPGFMRTPMSIVDGVDETETPEFKEWYVQKGKIPLRRTGYPEGVSGTVIFLASSYCRYMTGQLLVVDGGLMSTF